jgi:hypothetical protein
MPGDAPLDRTQQPRLGAVSRAAWRSLTWSLGAWRQLPPPASPASWAIGPWIEAASRWPVAPAEALPLRPQADAALLAELAGGVARAFRGRRVGFELGGRRVRAELDGLWLDRRDDRCGGRLELRSVECADFELETLSVVADRVALAALPRVSVTASGLLIEARAPLEPVVAWLNRRLPDWDLGVADGGLIQAVPRGGGKRLLVDAAVRDGELEVELRALRWRGLTLRCPAWLRLARRMPLPALPEGVLVAEASRRGSRVELRLAVADVRRAFDPGRLREAIRSADALA